MSESTEEQRVHSAAMVFAASMGASFFQRWINGEINAGQFADEFVKVWRMLPPEASSPDPMTVIRDLTGPPPKPGETITDAEGREWRRIGS